MKLLNAVYPELLTVSVSELQMNNSSVAFPNYCSLLSIRWTIDGRVTDNFFKLTSNKDVSCWGGGDPGGTVIIALYYKSEGRWFDSRWCHWNFSLT